MKKLLGMILISLVACEAPKDKKEIKTQSKTVEKVKAPTLNLEQANRLATLPVACINTEYPNKLSQTLGEDADLKSPHVLHPAFYGCFDWHSSVHGHWSLVSLLKQFPNLNDSKNIKKRLLKNISKENIINEVKYFDKKLNKHFERTYGWAWLLKLAQELHTWNDPVAKQLEENLQPLTSLIATKFVEFLPKLNYPIRVGEHTNTAFGLTFAWDYAETFDNKKLKEIIKKRAMDFYFNDKNCPLNWEPSGYDFLSPCLQEAAIMKRIMPKEDFKKWLAEFLPQLEDKKFHLEVGKVSDRTDGKLVHLDGVNFSRAWALARIIKDLPEYNHLKNIMYEHINYSLPSIVGDSYEGGHWLGTFAIYSLNSIK